ncbi:MAG: anaerobic ribonucleoside-triphosphate reductase activating protein [Faecalimonas sp.]|nr:anaerobic ribonucleoside-triphosphate reductase activating protein [Faecalimonas sp.]
MQIQGLQKLTLLDFPEKVACTVFTAGCNFRCPFCHNASLVTHVPQEAEMTEEAFFSFLKKRQGILDGVCITGGEPLLQKDIENFIRKIKELGYAVKLDTNGSFPDKLKFLVQEQLVDYVAMDIKNSLQAYAATAGTDARYLDAIQESVVFLQESHVPYEFRTTVTKNFHTKEEFARIGEWIAGCEKYFLQAFVNSGDLIDSQITGYDEEEMNEFLDVVKAYVPNAKLRGI